MPILYLIIWLMNKSETTFTSLKLSGPKRIITIKQQFKMFEIWFEETEHRPAGIVW